MVNNTSDQCAFACHDLSNSNNYYKLAKKLGVTMRIDVVRQATQQLTDTASATEKVTNQFRMAVYTFGSSCQGAGLNAITTLSSSLSSVKSAAGNIDLMATPYHTYNSDQCTDFDGVLQSMDTQIPAPGPGTSASPQNSCSSSPTALRTPTIRLRARRPRRPAGAAWSLSALQPAPR